MFPYRFTPAASGAARYSSGSHPGAWRRSAGRGADGSADGQALAVMVGLGVQFPKVVTLQIPCGHVMSTLEFIATLVFRLALMASAAWSVYWVYQEARRERKPAALIAFLVLITWPIGLVAWLFLRARRQRSANAEPNSPAQ
jgi:hypothetical protein